uniref:Uncharacterized protein n=2 Tax=Tetraselmis sp. GSL018 TaxID=582737 RepID=A0A061R6H9_9CHLO|eukprot:CAMPEP_0177592358 /NCGR_PEP_ID=MMETSP0419_2-20121207/8512_1 /TAXON_ID=582737 /ORGANISM="Tetraselmis sp., Strain GSL018" /LENGTH=189 /DNA_ID=CAMNT_0019083209 /DNA_START=395 /DNA_END=964 /DNA_ORIENTATION=+
MAKREAELTKVIHAYEESVFLKKVEVYREEVKRKEAELDEERTERKRLADELVKANKQIDVANGELKKANKIIEDEAVAISEWKAKTTQLESDFYSVKKERDDLQQNNNELTEYAKKKDTALQMVMGSLKRTEDARQKAEHLRTEVEKGLPVDEEPHEAAAAGIGVAGQVSQQPSPFFQPPVNNTQPWS